MTAGLYGESEFRLLTIIVIVAFDQVVRGWKALAPVIDGELGVKDAATQADSCKTVARGGIAVPYVWTPHVVPVAIERCICGVE